ncbi:hypothetical protein GCM10027169_38450 [Gordonia jinhuaensis]|uniref:Uncharacterized protein n=1 Tax=Gordonia jinhuaensis TaxID=1517702 RepID=A0A916WQS8_9ACTN|nr:hypothetical protein GCM10011489_10080 [Gordonia jinhuaensis]
MRWCTTLLRHRAAVTTLPAARAGSLHRRDHNGGMTTTRLRLLLAGVLLICVMIGAVHFAAQPGPSALDHRVWDWAISHRSRHLTPVVIGITRLFTPPWSVGPGARIGDRVSHAA